MILKKRMKHIIIKIKNKKFHSYSNDHKKKIKIGGGENKMITKK